MRNVKAPEGHGHNSADIVTKRGKAVFVLGMHRSGTSAMTGMLAQMGVETGNNLMPPARDENEQGFWEDLDVVMVHEQLLEMLGSRWDDPRPLPPGWWRLAAAEPFRQALIRVVRGQFGQHNLWALKDPRICRLLPLWLSVCNDSGINPRFVLIARQPFEVALSLERRNGFSFEKSALLWLAYNLDAELWTRGCTRTFVRYRHLLLDPKGAVLRIGKDLGVQWPGDKEAGLEAVQAFMNPSLRHHAAEIDDDFIRNGPLRELVADTWQVLIEAAQGNWREHRFDGLRDRFESHIREAGTEARTLRTRLRQKFRRAAVSAMDRAAHPGAGLFGKLEYLAAKPVLSRLRQS